MALSFDDLVKLLTPQAETLKLTGAQFNTPAMPLLFENFFASQTLTIFHAAAAPNPEKQQVVVTGNLQDGSFLNMIRAKAASAVFTLQPDKTVRLQLEVSVQDPTWKLSTSFPVLADSVFDNLIFANTVFTLDSAGVEALPDHFRLSFMMDADLPFVASRLVKGLSLSTQLMFQGKMAQNFAGIFTFPIAVSGPVEIFFQADPQANVRRPFPQLLLTSTRASETTHTIGSYSFTFDFQAACLLQQFPNQAGTDVGLVPTGVLAIRTNFSSHNSPAIPVAAFLYSAKSDELVLNMGASPLIALQTDQLPALLNGTDVSGSLNPGHGFPVFNSVTLSYLRLQIGLAPLELRSISLGIAVGQGKNWPLFDGLLTLQDIEFQITVTDTGGHFSPEVAIYADAYLAHNPKIVLSGYLTVPELNFACELDESVSMDLTAAFKGLTGDSINLPTITGGTFKASGNLSTSSYTLEALIHERWTIFGTSSQGLTLENIYLKLSRSGAASTSGSIFGTVDLGSWKVAVSASYSGAGWHFMGMQEGAENLAVANALQDIGKKVGISVPSVLLQAVQDVRINSLMVSFDTQSKYFELIGDSTTSGQIPLGLKSYQLETQAYLSSAAGMGQRVFSGHLEADLQIGKALFVVAYDFGPGAKTITGRWRSEDGSTLGFNDLAEALGIPHDVSVPQGLDLGLRAATFEYRAADGYFTLSAESALFGDAFFTAGKGQDGKLGFVFGVEFPPMAKLSSLPVIGNDLKAADFLSFRQAAIIIASNTFKNFVLPTLPPLPVQTPASVGPWRGMIGGRTLKPLVTGATLQLAPGLALVADLDFSGATHDRKLQNLQSILGQTQLLLQATLGQRDLSLFIALQGKVGIPTGKNSKLALANPGVRIDLTTETVFQLSGELDLTINGAKIVATARLIIDESEAEVAINISGDHGSLPPPPGIKGLHLEDFGLEMGVFFEPPGLDLGIQGKCRIGETQGTQDDEFAIVLEVIEEIPNLLYLSFYMDRLDLGQAVTLFTDRSEPNAVKSLEIVKLSDVGFHWAENVVVLPDGSIAQPGFGFSASIQIFSFGAHADVQVGMTTGISGHAEMSPINLKRVLSITGDGKGINRTYQQINGQWQLVANNNVVSTRPAPPTRKEVIVPPGGPVIELNSFHSPFVHVNWQVTLFDLVKTSVDVTVSDKGFSFVLTYQVAGIEKFDLHATLQDADHFNGSAEFHFGLNANIGPIHVAGINCGTLHLIATMNAGMEITLDPSRFSMSIHGGFKFQGLSFSLPALTLSVAPASLKELPGKVLQQIKDHADQIFATLFGDVQQWANMIGHGIVTGVTDMAHSLKNAYKVTAQDAARLMKTAQQAGATVAAGLKTAYGLTSDAATTAMKNAGYAASEVASGLKQAYGLADQAAATALKEAGYAVNDVAGGLRSAYGTTAQRATQLLKGAGYTVQSVGGALRVAYGATEQQAALALRSAGYEVNDVGNALKSAYGTTAQGAAQALRAAGFAATETSNALKSAYGQTADQAAHALKGAGYAANDAGNALKSVYGASANVAASALKSAGYAVDETGNFIKSAYNLGSDQVNNVLHGAGYAADQVKNFFGSTADKAKDFFHKIF